VQRVDSDALGIITRALGITGRGSAITEFLDGQLEQVFDVAPAIRRGRTLAGSEGIFTGLLQNVHTGATSLISQMRPFNATVGAIAPYPVPVPLQFDIWLLGAGLRLISGSGTLSAILDLEYELQGWGIDDSGVAVVATRAIVLANWDTVVTEGIAFGLQVNGGPYMNIGLRLPRSSDTRFTFRTTSSATSTWECQVILGLFPTSLGQDGAI